MTRNDLTAKEFQNALTELVSSLRRDIEAHQQGLDASPKAIAARRKRVLDGDFQFFAYTYFPHHIRGTPSLFQAQFCQRYPQLLQQVGGVKEWWIAPRGEAKSSMLTKIGPVWCAVQALLQRPEVRTAIGWTAAPPPFIDYIILLGAETELPAKLAEVVKTELTGNAALNLDFPEVCGKGAMWKIGEFITKTGVKVESFGAEQAIRGTFHGASRPKLLLGDDLITDAEAKSPTERQNRWTWLTKAIDYLGPPDGSVKYCGVGTILDKDDPISRAKKTIGHVVHHFRAIESLPENMDLWAQCEEHMRNDDARIVAEAATLNRVVPDAQLPSYRFYLANREAMDAGAVVSWPSVRSLFWLMRQRATAPRAFGTEMQGDPRSDEDKTFVNITFWVQRMRDWLLFGACDPSMGRGETSDPSAIIIGGLDPLTRRLHVLEAWIKRRVPSKLEADLITAQREFRCLAIAFENNNAYEHSRQTFVKAGLSAGVPLPLIGVTATVPAEVRIDSLEPYVSDPAVPSILLHSKLTQLLSELDTWPEPQSNHHYDGLTALHLLWHVAQTRGIGLYDQLQTQARRGSASHDIDRDDGGISHSRSMF
jgi:predicted phage terminase large subunit-like protein